MKYTFLLLLISVLYITHAAAQGVLDRAKGKIKQRADQKVDQGMDKGLDKTEEGIRKSTHTDNSQETASETSAEQKDVEADHKAVETPQAGTTANAPAIKVYNNYDFIPGDKILFEDNFSDDQDGEFPAHWELNAGQAVLNKMDEQLALNLTDGNYARVNPRMKTDQYLPQIFTLEYDWYYAPGAFGTLLLFKFFDKQEGFEREASVYVSASETSFSCPVGVELQKNLNPELSANIENHWHHIALVVKNHQLKLYVDQYRVLVAPDTKADFSSMQFAGIGSETAPVIFKNVRIAGGGGMNLIGKKFTDAKIITHGINFDYNKATLRPESMGVLNMVSQVMKDNPDIKFEIGGHTDADGPDDYNLKLSQQRAESVRSQLISMGVDASRLTAKGYGETKPINDNQSLEGKANNRRVEFVKQ